MHVTFLSIARLFLSNYDSVTLSPGCNLSSCYTSPGTPKGSIIHRFIDKPEGIIAFILSDLLYIPGGGISPANSCIELHQSVLFAQPILFAQTKGSRWLVGNEDKTGHVFYSSMHWTKKSERNVMPSQSLAKILFEWYILDMNFPSSFGLHDDLLDKCVHLNLWSKR